MGKTLVIYGLFLGVLAFILKITEYWFWIKLNAYDMYVLLTAGVFLGTGIWLGRRVQQQRNQAQVPDFLDMSMQNNINTEGVLAVKKDVIEKLNISKREYEVLQLLGKGMSNQAIADMLFVSQNTIKTHTSRLFEKLDVKNRTQAILKAKELGILLP